MNKTLFVNKMRLENHINSIAEFGKTSNDGVTRLALSKSDKEVRDYFCQYCKKLGLTVKVDDLGNIYATLEGKRNVPPIILGSHLDTVKKGGRFDGALGVIAGLEVVEVLKEHNIVPEIPITVVNFTNEEGVRFEPAMMSSGVIAGRFSIDKVMQVKDQNGVTFRKALEKIGYNGSKRNRLQKATAFIELHIEQGPILERKNRSIGIVECVVGMVCYEINITGESNHAGTTPMNLRKDALFKANDIISIIRKKLNKLDSDLVYTIGRLDVYPNLHTVIPGKVSFTIEARHKDVNVIEKVKSSIKEINSLQTYGDVQINIKKLWERETVWFDKEILNHIEEVSSDLNYSSMLITSGAGHDAQFISSIAPTAMIFVPSVKGVSHSEDEFTPIDDCYKGVNVLLNTVIRILNSN